MIQGKNYIDGQWQESSNALNPQKTFAKINPATGLVQSHFPETDHATVRTAISAAREAFKSWKRISRVKRAEYFDNLCSVMKKNADEIITMICCETGKTENEAKAEFNESLHMAQYTFSQGREPYGKWIGSEIAEKDAYVFRKPKGVVGVIAPWNFPFAIGGFWTSAPAILEGNTVVFKPSEETPYCGQLIAEIYHKAGFPKGVMNVIHGGGGTGAALVQGDVDHICFTGSAEVGQSIRRLCADTFHKSCSCEMGSKSAVIVFGDTPAELAIPSCVASAFKLSGQRCVSAGRLLIQRKIFADFSERFVEAVKKLKVGNPRNINDCYMGPLISEAQMKRVLEFNKMTVGTANILLEGERLPQDGWYLTPHVYTCEWNDQYTNEGRFDYLKKEVFGPHVALIPFDDADDAVRIYNDTDYGLSMSVLTNNMSIARYMRDNCDFGLGYHNLPCIGAESHLPFGGVKKSGSGGSSAAGSFHAVTHEVTWTANFQPDGFSFCQGMK